MNIRKGDHISFFFLFSFSFPQPVLFPKLLCCASYTLITPVLLISHHTHVWFCLSYLRGPSDVRNYFWILVLLKGTIYVTSRLFACKIIILAKFASLITSEVSTYTGDFRADYVTLRVEIIHLTWGGIWINLNLSQGAMEGKNSLHLL